MVKRDLKGGNRRESVKEERQLQTQKVVQHVSNLILKFVKRADQ